MDRTSKFIIGLIILATGFQIAKQRSKNQPQTEAEASSISDTLKTEIRTIEVPQNPGQVVSKSNKLTNQAIEVMKDSKGKPTGLYGRFPLNKKSHQENSNAVFEFVKEIAPHLEISNPGLLAFENERHASLGTVTTFHQEINGIEVEGSMVQVQQNSKGDIIGVDSSFTNGLESENTNPKISPEQAVEICLKELKLNPEILHSEEMALVLSRANDNRYHLYYKIPIRDLSRGPSGAYVAQVDAVTGEVIKKNVASH